MYYVIVISLKDIESFDTYQEAITLYLKLIKNGFDAIITKSIA